MCESRRPVLLGHWHCPEPAASNSAHGACMPRRRRYGMSWAGRCSQKQRSCPCVIMLIPCVRQRGLEPVMSGPVQPRVVAKDEIVLVSWEDANFVFVSFFFDRKHADTLAQPGRSRILLDLVLAPVGVQAVD